MDRDGDGLACHACRQLLRYKYFPAGSVLIGGLATLRGIALRCRICGAITCIECAMQLTAGQAQACPQCKTILGPTIFMKEVIVENKLLG
jgi:hypothetical protein